MPRKTSPHHNATRRWATLAAVAAGALLLTGCAPWRMWTAADLAAPLAPQMPVPLADNDPGAPSSGGSRAA